MLQKTIIATLLALLSGIPLLKAQTLDTTSADTLISITDSLISEVIREIKKEINEIECVNVRPAKAKVGMTVKELFNLNKN